MDKKPYFIVGAYFQQSLKREILQKLNNLFNRIRNTYNNAEIILFWDLNPDKDFSPEAIKKTLKLNYSELNKNLITREEMIHSINWRSTLDYYFSTQYINQLITLDKNESDH